MKKHEKSFHSKSIEDLVRILDETEECLDRVKTRKFTRKTKKQALEEVLNDNGTNKKTG
tara:strand:- start:474 stop:650 length:177 start_codon:yes stop_codon:yes gene_type:complete